LLALGAKAVLMKGGHFNAPVAIDFLVTPQGVESFASPRIDTKNLHGTGCTLSSAITAGLAKGMTFHASIKQAKAYITGAIAASNELNIGHGKGPTHHFHGIW
jgi:hydroxymethylpyrimidine/phosphomethylpyrimidine kinase